MSRSLAFRPARRLARPGDFVAGGLQTRNEQGPMHHANNCPDCRFCRQFATARPDTGSADIMTIACAVGPSSVKETSILASQPTGVIERRRTRAPPVSLIVG